MLLPLALFINLIAASSIYLKQSKYKVIYNNGKIPQNTVNSFMSLNDNIGDVGKFDIVDISRLESVDKYLCFLPQDRKNEVVVANDVTQSSKDNLLANALQIITETFNRSTCVFAYTLHGDYWTFAYCFGDKIIQYHEDLNYLIQTSKHKSTQPDFVYTLGRFPGAPSGVAKIENQAKDLHNDLSVSSFQIFDNNYSPFVSDFINQDSSQKMLHHTLYNGEVCDLTKKPRSIDVIYRCDSINGDLQIVDVSEIQTCKYQMVVNVPTLCSLPEFRPVNHTENEIEIECKEIDTSIVSNKNITDYNDFFYFTNVDEEHLFPEKNHKVNLRDYLLLPTGAGFYLGFLKETSSYSSIFRNKCVFFYNRDTTTPTALLDHFANMYKSVMDRKVPSPITIDESHLAALNWNDSFIAWYDLYDFYGKLNSIVRVARDGSNEKRILDFQIINPDNMLDQDGDLVEVGEFSAPNGVWNFESFYRPGKVDRGLQAEQATKTVYVTKVAETAPAQETDAHVDIQATGDAEDISFSTDSASTLKKDAFELLASELGLENYELLQEILDNLNLHLVREEDELDVDHDELDIEQDIEQDLVLDHVEL